jgi:glyoxylase-like metal-dependent hydrolase (beta-lactamase superfamily II)
MKLARWLVITAVAMAACTPTPAEKVVINEAAKALGGEARIKAVNTLVLEGTGENGTLGQNLSPEAPLPILKVTEFKLALDFANGRYRLEQTRTATAPGANPAPTKQIQGLDGKIAFNVAASGTATRAADTVANDRRKELYQHHPLGILRAALTEGAQITNPRKEGNDQVVDITTAQGDRVRLYVDSTTNLPTKATSPTYNANLGDIPIETTFADYVDVDGLKVPGKITVKTDKYTTVDLRITKSTPNGNAGDIAAPEAVKSAPAPVPAITVTAEEVSKGIWYLTGGSHHSILVEFADHLALIEAPQNEARTDAVIKKVKELQPAKPIKYVINTHHHFDHSGGVRRAVAEGATLVTHAGNKAFFENVVARKHASMPDTLSKSPKPLVVQPVSEKVVMKDATRTIELYPIAGSMHTETMLMVYFPAERLLVEADLYSPPAANAAPNAPPAPQPFAPNLLENIQKANLRVDRILPIHGKIAPFQDLVTAAKGS